MTIKFKDMTLHGRERFLPNHAYGFEDPGAEAYFKAAFGAEDTTDAPDYVFPAGLIEIDPGTIQNESGLLVSDIARFGGVEEAIAAGATRPSEGGELTPNDSEAPATV